MHHGGKYLILINESLFGIWLTNTLILAKCILISFEFYSGHCKQLAPEYSAAAEVLSKNDPPLSLAKVDATEQKGVADRFGIQGFPTLFWFV